MEDKHGCDIEREDGTEKFRPLTENKTSTSKVTGIEHAKVRSQNGGRVQQRFEP